MERTREGPLLLATLPLWAALVEGEGAVAVLPVQGVLTLLHTTTLPSAPLTDTEAMAGSEDGSASVRVSGSKPGEARVVIVVVE